MLYLRLSFSFKEIITGGCRENNYRCLSEKAGKINLWLIWNCAAESIKSQAAEKILWKVQFSKGIGWCIMKTVKEGDILSTTAQTHQQDLERLKSLRYMDDDFMTVCLADNYEVWN